MHQRNLTVETRLNRGPVGRLFSASCITLALLIFAATGSIQAQPAFDKTFLPDTIGIGSVSTLQFSITNSSAAPATQAAFSDSLPAGVVIADPANANSTCIGDLVANPGTSSISFTNGGIGGNETCIITVDVTSSTVGTHTNVSGDLTSSQGNSGNATDDLIVATNRPGFSKSFTPASINLGERSTLSFTIDNSANANQAFALSFTDNLPSGMVVADPANANSTCNGGVITATVGSGVISYGPMFFPDASVAAGATCTISVDVTTPSVGMLDNISGELTSTSAGPTLSSGRASATLDVNVDTIHLTKSFTDDPVAPGDTVTLEFTIFNRDRGAFASDIEFTDDLDAVLSGLAAVGLPASNVCGAGSQLSGTGLLSLTGASLGPGEFCTFSVTLQVPANAAPGGYANTTSTVSATLGGVPFEGNSATEVLFVDTAPILTKTFLSNPVGGGDTVTMEFSITNTSTTSSATNIAFLDNLDAFITGIVVSALPAPGFCGAGSTIAAINISGDLHLSVSGANLAASDSCTFSVDIQVPVGAPEGAATNTTGDIRASINGLTSVGNPASASLTIAEGPEFAKDFVNDPVAAGDTVTLEFTISHSEEASAGATDISFTDDLNSTGLSGLVATGLPLNDVCGTGSQISGTDVLSFTGGSLAAGETCVIQVTLQTPASALPGTYTNTTSDISANVGGLATADLPASSDLIIAGLELAKSFTNDPAIPGGTVNLEFTVSNTSATFDATNIVFSDNLNAVLPGLVPIAPLPSEPCGTGSLLSTSGAATLVLTGGNLTAGTSCTFSVDLQVPSGATPGFYSNVTGALTADINGTQVALSPATDALEVSGNLLLFDKAFTESSVAPGDTIGLQFSIVNQSATDTITDIAFSDDLDAALAGLVATGLPLNDVCGTGSTLSGTSVITLTGGQLGPGASCDFVVTLQVPANAEFGAGVTNVTDRVTGLVGELEIAGDPAVASFEIDSVVFSKAFAAGGVVPGGTTLLSFTISNFGSEIVDRMFFTDDLDAVIPGLIAIGLPSAGVCGEGSAITGTSVLTFTGGILGPGEICTFDVTVQLPTPVAAGDYPNVTSELTSVGTQVLSPPATDALTVLPDPGPPGGDDDDDDGDDDDGGGNGGGDSDD